MQRRSDLRRTVTRIAMLERAWRRGPAPDQRTLVYRNQSAVATDRSGEAAVCHGLLLFLAEFAGEILSGIRTNGCQ
jgi:hypothetical protein